MDQIKSYIDNIFSGYIQNTYIINLKKEIIENLSLKYQDLLKEGLDSDQALGRVVRDFGSIDELEEELKEYKLSPGKKIEKNKLNALKAFAWMITIAIYMYTGMAMELWHINWIIFLIMAGLDNLMDAYI